MNLFKSIVKGMVAQMAKLFLMMYRGGYRELDKFDDVSMKASKLGYEYYNPYTNIISLNACADDIDLSIIVPVYNVEKYLCQCIDSLLNQVTRFRFEIILVNDASKDSSLSICNQYARDENRIRVLNHSQNLGVSCARNTGICASKGRYLMFLDSDDFVEESVIEELMSRAVSTNADIVKCEYNLYYSDGSKIPANRYAGINNSYSDGLGADMMHLTYAWGAVIKRELWDSVRFPVRYLYEDMMMAHLIFMQAKRFEYVNIPLWNYRQDNNNSLTKDNVKKVQNPRQLDQAFLAFSTLEYMYSQNMNFDNAILNLTIREFGKMMFIRVNRKYRRTAFEIACITMDKLLKMLSNRECSLSDNEKRWLDIFRRGAYVEWMALSLVEKYAVD